VHVSRQCTIAVQLIEDHQSLLYFEAKCRKDSALAGAVKPVNRYNEEGANTMSSHARQRAAYPRARVNRAIAEIKWERLRR